jgi:alkylation response protein AidB-like acyl-CoA dehydrogenase
MANTSRFPVADRDQNFVLFDVLGVDRIVTRDAYAGGSRADLEVVLKEATRFAREQIWPTNVPGDREGCRREGNTVKVPTSFKALYRAYTEAGWLALTTDERFGGAKLPASFAIAVGETMTSANLSFSPYPGLTRGAARLLERFGSGFMKEVVVPKLYDGTWAGTMCLTEPHAGTAVGDLKTTAAKVGDRYRIRGAKIFISGGEQDLTDNIVHLVLARTTDAPAGIKGVSLFLVPKHRFDGNGTITGANDVTCVGIEEKMGLHGSSTCQLAFGENEACEGFLVGEENQGIQIMFQLMNEARIGTGLHGLSAATVAYQVARDYAAERVQGTEIDKMRDVNAPRVTIDQHPDVRRMLFTMKAKTEGMRALLYKAAFLADEAKTNPDSEAREQSQRMLELLTPLVKSHCSDTGFDVCIMAMQTLGGAGYTKDYVVEQLARDVKVASIYEGANGIQALDLIGRKLGANHGQSFMELMAAIESTVERVRENATLASLALRLEETKDTLRRTTGHLAALGMGGDVKHASLYASPFLTMMSQVVTAWLLVEQGVVAHERLIERATELNIDVGSDLLTRAHDDGAMRFYASKIAAVRMYVGTVLADVDAHARVIESGEQSILEAPIV